MKENCEAREKQALLEMRNREREQAARKKGSFKFFSRSSNKNLEEDIRKEFEAKSRPRKIDVRALEESRKERAKQHSDDQQRDFRHLLRKTDGDQPSRGKKTVLKSEGRSVETDRHRVLKHLPRAEDKKKTKIITSQAELTGSWDYIPSEVDLTAGQPKPESHDLHREESQQPRAVARKDLHAEHSTEFGEPHTGHEKESYYEYYQDEEGGEYYHYKEASDDMRSSSPLIDLLDPTGPSTEAESEWDRSVGGQNRLNQEYDFETQF